MGHFAMVFVNASEGLHGRALQKPALAGSCADKLIHQLGFFGWSKASDVSKLITAKSLRSLRATAKVIAVPVRRLEGAVQAAGEIDGSIF